MWSKAAVGQKFQLSWLSTSVDSEKKMSSFDELGLDEGIVDSCSALAIHTPTEIQSESIPVLLSGANAVIVSPTGSGKTLCFAAPVIQALARDPYGVFCVVLTPVRELAYQIQQQFAAIGSSINLKTCLMVGGKSTGHQSNIITRERPHVVIGTPGRLADTLRVAPDVASAFKRVKILVLDEADRLLAGSGFAQDLLDIMRIIPSKQSRQTILVTATISDKVKDLQSKFGGDNLMPIIQDSTSVSPDGKLQLPTTITNKYILVPSLVRMVYLHHLLRVVFPTQSVIIFTRTIRSCQIVASSIEKFLPDMPENQGKVACLHSLLEGQSRRFAALGKFRNQNARILVATDVAARGLDIPKVAVVINYELSTDVSTYVHRVGRCGRQGNIGTAISLISDSEIDILKAIEEEIGSTMEPVSYPEDTVLERLTATSTARREAEAILTDTGFDEKLKQYKKQRTSR